MQKWLSFLCLHEARQHRRVANENTKNGGNAVLCGLFLPPEQRKDFRVQWIRFLGNLPSLVKPASVQSISNQKRLHALSVRYSEITHSSCSPLYIAQKPALSDMLSLLLPTFIIFLYFCMYSVIGFLLAFSFILLNLLAQLMSFSKAFLRKKCLK